MPRRRAAAERLPLSRATAKANNWCSSSRTLPGQPWRPSACKARSLNPCSRLPCSAVKRASSSSGRPPRRTSGGAHAPPRNGPSGTRPRSAPPRGRTTSSAASRAPRLRACATAARPGRPRPGHRRAGSCGRTRHRSDRWRSPCA